MASRRPCYLQRRNVESAGEGNCGVAGIVERKLTNVSILPLLPPCSTNLERKRILVFSQVQRVLVRFPVESLEVWRGKYDGSLVKDLQSISAVQA